MLGLSNTLVSEDMKIGPKMNSDFIAGTENVKKSPSFNLTTRGATVHR